MDQSPAIAARASPSPNGRPVLRAEAWQTLRLALPVMGARAGLLAMVTVDTIMCGRVSGDALAFYAIATAPFVILMLVGMGLLSGTIVLVAQADGAGERARCGLAWRAALLNAVALGLALGFSMLPAEWLLGGLRQDPAVVAGGAPVMRALAWGLPGLLVFNTTGMLLEGIGRPRPVMVVMLAANVLNALLNALLMFGPWQLGAEGAAIATSVTRWAMAGALVAYALTMPGHARWAVRGSFRGTAALQRPLWKLGTPLALAQGLETGAFQGLTVFAGWLGTHALAAHQAAVNLNALVYMLTLGVATAAAVRVGHAVGRGDQPGLRRAGWMALAVLVAVMLALGPLIALLRDPIAWIYTIDASVQVAIAWLLLAVAVTILPDGGQGVMTQALRGASDVWLPTLVHLVSWWCVTVPVAYVAAFLLELGVAGLWAGIFSGALVAWIGLAWRFATVSTRSVRPI